VIDDPLVASIESLWAPDDGFFFVLRQGTFRQNEFDRAMDVLRRVPSFANGESLPRDVVPLVWFIPTSMSWQRERVARSGGEVEALDRATMIATEEVARILGWP
jgi:hypothetical protein